MSARNLVAALLVVVCVGGGVANAQTTTTAASGDTVTIGVGSRDGVRVGMTGRITKQEMVGGQLQSFEIARFRVTAVESASCNARLTDVGEGWRVESGMEVVFDQPLVRPQQDTATIVIRSNLADDLAYLDGRRLGPTPQRVEVAPGEHTVRVEKNGYEAAERRVTVSAGQEAVIRAELTPAAEDRTELLFWESIKDSSDPRDFEEYLRRWPTGPFAGLARNRVGAARPGTGLQQPGSAPQSVARPGAEWTDPAIGMKFRYIPAGSFEMGSPSTEAERDSDERQHRVTITRGYWMGETEVTQGQWRAVMGTNPSSFSACGESCPVEKVSWLEAVEFANRLSRKAGLAECYRISGETVSFVGLGCGGYRLPTEAEWERAARAGGSHRYAGGDDLGSLGWYLDNSNSQTHPVGQKRANGWGLHDMSGNVWEWVWDWSGEYPSGAVNDPTGPSGGSDRVSRGGSWVSFAWDCRSALRIWDRPGSRSSLLGLRLVRAAG